MSLSQGFEPFGNRAIDTMDAPLWGKNSCRDKDMFTDKQIAFALKQAELGTSVEEVCRKIAISEATYFV